MISSILIKTKRKEGFTLIELLVVIAIIGTLSTIGFLALSGASDGADDAKKLAELQSIRSAATVELSKNRAYPIVTTGKIDCARMDFVSTTVLSTLNDMKEQLSGFTHDNYVYCSNGDGTKFLVATDLAGKLPSGSVVAGVKGGGSTGTAASVNLPTGDIKKTASGTIGAAGLVRVNCQASGAASGTYCIGNL